MVRAKASTKTDLTDFLSAPKIMGIGPIIYYAGSLHPALSGAAHRGKNNRCDNNYDSRCNQNYA